MISEGRKDIDELFMVRTESMTLLAALLSETSDKSRVAGRVHFSDGSVTAFRHPAGDRTLMREKISTMCSAVALFYNTEVFHRKLEAGSAGMMVKKWEKAVVRRLN